MRHLVIESSGKMINSLFGRLGRIFYLVPAKYWYTVTGISIVSVVGGIANSVISPPQIIPMVAEVKDVNSRPEISAFIEKKQIAVPAAIGKGNIFRTQRRDHRPPPPPKAVAKVEKPKDGKDGDEVPEIVLKGIIISGDQRLAIVDGDVKRFIKTPMYAGDTDVSGAKFLRLKAKGLAYRITAIGTEKLVGETFYEGSILSGYLLEHVFENGIELVNIQNGKRLKFFLDTDEHQRNMDRKFAKKRVTTTKRDGTPLHMSGASR